MNESAKQNKAYQTRSIGANEKSKEASATNLGKGKVKQITRSNCLDLKARNPNKNIYKEKLCEAG